MSSQDISNLLLLIQKMTFSDSVCRNSLAIVRKARNTLAHKGNLVEKQVQEYLKYHRDFTKSFLKAFSSDFPTPISESSIDAAFDLIFVTLISDHFLYNQNSMFETSFL